MADLLSIGASGVRAYQTALTTVSENIANSSNASYARRVANIREVNTAGGKSSLLTGLGSQVTGITRTGDPYTEESLRTSSSDLSRTEAGSVWLQQIESGLTGSGLSTRVTAFFAAGNALSADPTSTALRASMLSSAESVSDAFETTGRSLDDSMTQLDSRAGQAVDELTRLNQALMKVNQGLGRTQAGTSAAAQLGDQRDTLLEQMSAFTDMNVQYDPAGRATVRVGGATGPVMVDAMEAADVTFSRSGGNVVLAIQRSDGVSAMTPTGGALAGMVEGAQRIATAKEQLEDTASDFVAKVNQLQANGDDASGAAGQAMFTVTGSPTQFKVALTNGSQIAAASRGGGARDASNLAQLAALRTSGGYEDQLQAQVTNNAATLSQRNLVASAQSAIRDGAVTARSEVSGVSLDSEAVDLVRFQQAYQASSRVIQIAKETFQSILEIR
jgi:flagellar hook-associated protein 1 FlgK